MVSQMVFQVMLVFGDKRTLEALEHLLGFDVFFCVFPEGHFRNGHKITLLTFKRFDFAVRVYFGRTNVVVFVAAVQRS